VTEMDGIPVEADQLGEAQAGLSCETSRHSANGRLVVTSVLFCSYRPSPA
jgi:hypothetical protein